MKSFKIVGVLALLCAACVAMLLNNGKATHVYARASADFHVVVDAGHGGKDKGAESANGTTESDINLSIAKYLAKELGRRGIGVTLTRTDSNSLAPLFVKNKKQADMKARREIIEKVKPDLVVSVHLNSFISDKSVRGLQCFYAPGSETGQKFAAAVQNGYNKSIQDNNRVAKTGDYYILDSTAYPAILVECGFLSNHEEELLLKTKEYQKVLAYYIAEAIAATR